MQLYEKLTFLMNLTQTSNRMMARELRVDPSLISRLRTGKRGLPRNRDHVRGMAAYLSKRCATEYQRQALSEMLGMKRSLAMKNDQLSEILYYWLCGDIDELGGFMRTFETFEIATVKSEPAADPCRLSTGTTIYYDNEGKRAAAKTVYQHLRTLEHPGTILIFDDEADDWILEDGEFTLHLQEWGQDLLQRGFRIIQITPPVFSADQAFESLIRWLPLYMTGLTDAYYYPRIRDHVHRRLLVAVPGEVAMMSSSIAGRRSSYSTLLTTERRLIQAYEAEFQDYLSMCRPMLNTYTRQDEQLQCFTRFRDCSGSWIQKQSCLSLETAPPEVLRFLIESSQDLSSKRLYEFYLREKSLIEKEWRAHELLDIVTLASPEDVRCGKVPALQPGGGVYYTPETYVLHLKNIVRMMETCENYHFIPVQDRREKSGALMVKESQRALLVRTAAPFTVFEMVQPEIVAFCREYLLRIADRSGYTGLHRAKTLSHLRELIRELQQDGD